MRKDEVKTIEDLISYVTEHRGVRIVTVASESTIAADGVVHSVSLESDAWNEETIDSNGAVLKDVIATVIERADDEWDMHPPYNLREVTPVIQEVTGIANLERQLEADHQKFAAELAGELAPGIREVTQTRDVAPGIREVTKTETATELAPGIREVPRTTQVAQGIREVTAPTPPVREIAPGIRQVRACCAETRRTNPNATRCFQCGRTLQ